MAFKSQPRVEFWDKLVQPFSMTEMCMELDTCSISALLAKPLVQKIILPEAPDSAVIFAPGPLDDYIPEIAYMFGDFMNTTLEKGTGEIIFRGFYDRFLMKIVRCLKVIMDGFLNVVEAADVSLRGCTTDLGRNLVIFVGGVPVVSCDYNGQGLQGYDHNQGFTASVYGDLEYILGYRAFDTRVQFLLMPRDVEKKVQKLLPELDITQDHDRQVFVRTILNIFRWARTLQKHQISRLSFYRFLKDHRRDCWGSEDVSVNLGLNHVEKQFALPDFALKDFIELYTHLMNGVVDNAILPITVLVDGISIATEDKIPRVPVNKKRKVSIGCRWIELHLTPVGCHATLVGPHLMGYVSGMKAVATIKSLLECLQKLHSLGFCHYDVRLENVVEYRGKFLLIDFEMAGKTGSDIPSCFPPKHWKKGCDQVYTEENDLYMVGYMIQWCTETTPIWLKELGCGLLAGNIKSAAEAYSVLISKNSSAGVP